MEVNSLLWKSEYYNELQWMIASTRYDRIGLGTCILERKLA
jgi:hypothetical protein